MVRQTGKSISLRWNRIAHLALVCGLGLATLISPAIAAPEGVEPGQANTELASRARAVLEAHCARCHQTGKLENPPAKGRFGDVLALDALLTREDLVTPGDPDASKLYQIMLARHRPLPVFFGPVPGPTAAEIGAVRDWLSSVSPRASGCSDKPTVKIDDIERDITAWRQAFETDIAKPLRFVSLANLHNLCRSDAQLAAFREAVSTLLTRLTLRPVTSLDTVGDANVLLAFRPTDLGLTAEAWDLRAGAGDVSSGVVSAEHLAARALAAYSTEAGDVGGAMARADAADGSLIDGVDPVLALALEHTRPVYLARAAAELQLNVDSMRARIADLTGDDAALAVRLRQTGLSRREWEELKARMLGRTPPPTLASPAADGDRTKLHLALWTNAAQYKAGDLLTIFARPSATCHLTIVAVDDGGLATVLFPNDTATDNQIQGGRLVQVPPSAAPFQLRLDTPGRHSLVAICNAVAKRPVGIGHDFERQRFTVLGDWRQFLLETAEREQAYQKTQEDLRRFRTGAGPAAKLEEQIPIGTEDEARTALTLEVIP